MFTIGYLLNEAPSVFRFALLSESFDVIAMSRRPLKIFRVSGVRNLYGLLDVVKSYYEFNVLSNPEADIAGVLLGRPSREAEFDLQFVVYRNGDQVKRDLALLLRRFGLLAKIEERVDEFRNLRSIFPEPKVAVASEFFNEEMESDSLVPIIETGRRTRKVRSRSALRDTEHSPEPERLRGLLLAISDGLTVENLSPPPASEQDLQLPKIHISKSVDSFENSLKSLSFKGSSTPRDTWSTKGHGNLHLGRKAQAFKGSLDSSSSDTPS
jgi:hypothetical protein